MEYESFLELAKKRRSIRKFKPEPIPDEDVAKIIEAARWAPSGANSQPWEFIIIKKQELRDRITELIGQYHKLVREMEITRVPELRFHLAAPGYVRAPVFIILCGDPRTKGAYPLDVIIRRRDSIFNSSLANALLYMTLAATTLGLASQWVSAINYPYAQAFTRELLGIPQELEFYDMLAVGYPDIKPKPRLVRAREEMVHHDYYDQAKFRTGEEVKDFIAALRRGRPQDQPVTK